MKVLRKRSRKKGGESMFSQHSLALPQEKGQLLLLDSRDASPCFSMGSRARVALQPRGSLQYT